MSTDPTAPSEIAARLTPRQKAALMWLPADGSVIRMTAVAFPGKPPTPDIPDMVRIGRRTGLSCWDDGGYRLTPLGRRVREEEVARGMERSGA